MIKKISALLFIITLFSVQLFAVDVYPNPWIPDSKKEGDLHGSLAEAGWIHFDNLPEDDGTIYIYNSTGELVRKIEWVGTRLERWNGRNDRHEYIGSGIYIWVIKSAGTKSGKIVIIR